MTTRKTTKRVAKESTAKTITVHKSNSAKQPAPLFNGAHVEAKATALVQKEVESKSNGRIDVSFSLVQPLARQVSLCGDFNAWSAASSPMKCDKNGCWRTSVTLSPGRYEYKFIVDGEWVPDPEASENVYNHYGTLNSVVQIRDGDSAITTRG